MTLEEEKKSLERERRRLERERQEFSRRVEIEDRRLEQQRNLFDMKFRILEEELQKLATERRQVEQQKQFYKSVTDREHRYTWDGAEQVEGIGAELFFSGVASRQSLKKRYKDLIKIYHPDNLDGDKHTIQEINREYDQLSKVFIS